LRRKPVGLVLGRRVARCTLNSCRPEGKARPGLLGGEHLRRGYALQRAAAVGQGPDGRAPGRRWSPSPVEALSSSSSTHQRDGPSASRTPRRQGSIGEHQVARLRGPGRPADSQRPPRVRLGVGAGAGSDTVQLLWAPAASRPAARRRRAAASLQRRVVCASPWCGEAGHGAGHGGRLLVVIPTGCRYPFRPPRRAGMPGAAPPLGSGTGFAGQRRS
jgi:hypothetical protein